MRSGAFDTVWPSANMIEAKVMIQCACIDAVWVSLLLPASAAPAGASRASVLLLPRAPAARAYFCSRGILAVSTEICHRRLLYMGKGEEKKEKADSTLRSSQAVPHPSTDRALCRLTSEVK